MGKSATCVAFALALLGLGSGLARGSEQAKPVAPVTVEPKPSKPAGGPDTASKPAPTVAAEPTPKAGAKPNAKSSKSHAQGDKPSAGAKPASGPNQPAKPHTTPPPTQSQEPGPDASKPAPAPSPETGEAPADGKPTTHFASLRADKVFLRNGPSSDYPIQWVYQRKGLPVEVLASYDVWRKVRDMDGVEGWVHQQMLTGRRSVLVTGAVRDMRQDPEPTASIVARLEPGVIAAIAHCKPDWCELKAGGYRGWVRRDEVWGVQRDEVIE